MPDLEAWLTARVAEHLERPPEGIRPDVSLAEYGLDSMGAYLLCGEIEDHLGITLDAEVAWDYPSIEALVGYLRGAFP